MDAIKIEHQGSRLFISIDKNQVDTDSIVNLLEKLRIEFLARKIDFDEGIENFGQEVKNSWWENNKHKFPS